MPGDEHSGAAPLASQLMLESDLLLMVSFMFMRSQRT
jgi:hypothetical protein